MEFTQEEKNKLYSKCLEDILSGKHLYCCGSFYRTIQDDFPEKYNNISTDEFLSKTNNIFSELFQLRTNNHFKDNDQWFDKNEERIEALKKCIELTK